MSFFGNILAGAAGGVGAGLVGMGTDQERSDAALALLREKQSGELQRQRERLDDQSALRLTLAGMKEPAGGGKGGELNLFALAQQADTPDKQSRLMETTRAFAGDDAANVLGRIFGKTDTSTVNPSTGDLARYDRTLDENGQSTAPVPTSYTQRVQFDAQKGTQGLQRLMALAMDPAKAKAYAEGEAQYLRNDVTSNITLPDAIRSGDRSPDNMNDALSPLNPRAGLETDKNSLAAERIQQAREAELGRAERAGSSLSARGKELLLTERKNLVAATSGTAGLMLDPTDLASMKARMAEIDALLRTPINAPNATAPIAAPRSPSRAAAAFKAGKNY